MEAAAEDRLRSALEALDDLELLDLESALTDAGDDLEEATKTSGVELKLSKSMPRTRNSYYRELDSLTAKLEAGDITQARFETDAGDLISKNFEQVYKDHRGLDVLTPGDEEYLNRAVADEMKYAAQFGQDIVDDSLLMPRQQRAGMYSNTLNGIAQHAQVEALPDDARMNWVLGDAEHCVDCLILAANSPYSKWDLPTTPRAGATVCLSNCRCKLKVVKGRLSRAEKEDAAAFGTRKDQSLSEMVEQPAPPKGMRSPSPKEQKYIDRLRSKINTNRRIVATEKNPKKLRKAVSARREANEELIEFLEKNDVYEVPVWSVDDVLDERHIGKRSVRDIFRHGLDGRSLSLIDKKKLGTMLSRYEKLTGELLSDDAILKGLGV